MDTDKNTILNELKNLARLMPKDNDFDEEEIDDDRVKIRGLIKDYNMDIASIEEGLGERKSLENDEDYQSLNSQIEEEKTAFSHSESELSRIGMELDSANKIIETRTKAIAELNSKNDKIEIRNAEIKARKYSNSADIEANYDRLEALTALRQEKLKDILKHDREIRRQKAKIVELNRERSKLKKEFNKSKMALSTLENRKKKIERRYDLPDNELGESERLEILKTKVTDLKELSSLLRIEPYRYLRETIHDFEDGYISELELNERLSKIRSSIALTSEKRNLGLDEENKPEYFSKIESMIEKLPKDEKYNKEAADERLKSLQKTYLELDDMLEENENKDKKKIIPILNVIKEKIDNKKKATPILKFDEDKDKAEKLRNRFKKTAPAWVKKTLLALAAVAGLAGSLTGAFLLGENSADKLPPADEPKQEQYDSKDDKKESLNRYEKNASGYLNSEEWKEAMIKTRQKGGRDTGGITEVENPVAVPGTSSSGSLIVDGGGAGPGNGGNNNGGNNGGGGTNNPEKEATYTVEKDPTGVVNQGYPEGETVVIDFGQYKAQIDYTGTAYVTLNGTYVATISGAADVMSAPDGKHYIILEIHEEKIRAAIDEYEAVMETVPSTGNETPAEGDPEAEEAIEDEIEDWLNMLNNSGSNGYESTPNVPTH